MAAAPNSLTRSSNSLALPGYWQLASPAISIEGVAATAVLGYGVTEAIDWAPGVHHRLRGRVALAGSLLPWLNLSAYSDVRHDRHGDDADGADQGTILTSGLYMVAGKQLSGGVSLGLGLGGKFHRGSSLGNSLGNPTADVHLLASYQPEQAGFAFGGRLGFRYDRSSNTVDDPESYRPGDRLSLGVSDSNAMQVGVGGRYDIGSRQLIGELSGDILIGSEAPPLSQSPYRVSLGVTQPLTAAFGLQVLGRASQSARPAEPQLEALSPLEPRAEVLLSLVYRTPSDEPAEKVEAPARRPAEPVVTLTARVEVEVRGPDGERISDAVVKLKRGEEELELPHQNLGTYGLDDVQQGSATVIVQADRLQTRTLQIDVGEGPVTLTAQLDAAAETGQIRGLIRSFSGAALSARIFVEPGGTELRTAKDGSFSVDVAPGKYQVVVEAPGHQSQRRRVEVTADGVVILNADLRRGKR